MEWCRDSTLPEGEACIHYAKWSVTTSSPYKGNIVLKSVEHNTVDVCDNHLLHACLMLSSKHFDEVIVVTPL